jgi:predicted DCC family thiol-disulfide oxidoreductase YuxK
LTVPVRYVGRRSAIIAAKIILVRSVLLTYRAQTLWFQRQAMERFHVRAGNGQLLSGAAAFVEVWARLPSWRWATRAAAFPGILAVIELSYRLFLPARPTLAMIFGRIKRLKDIRWPSKRPGDI